MHKHNGLTGAIMAFGIETYAHTMAQYNRWMNDNLYEACAALSDEQRKADVGLFFQSIHGTLNHLLLCDQMWFARFMDRPYAGKSLSAELFSSFNDLRHARREMDDEIERWALDLQTNPLPQRLHYVSLRDQQSKDVDFARTVVHFFNHQTHHRGQITAALSRLGIDFGVTDLLFMPEPPANN
tara:strand:- start:181169 stop:181717 length:549 start_codon:yes stop_codon:yes gene_type:complete